MKPSVLGSLFGFKDYLFLEEKQSFLLQIEEEEKLHRYSGKMKAFIIKKKKKSIHSYASMFLCNTPTSTSHISQAYLLQLSMLLSHMSTAT